MIASVRHAAVAVTMLCWTAGPLLAQPAGSDSWQRSGRFEVAIGGLWSATADLGTVNATETGANGSRFVLFSTSNALASSFAGEARVSVRLSRLVDIEAAGTLGSPTLRTTISADVENATQTVATAPVREATVSGAVVWRLERWRIGTRGHPFVSGGAGYVRDLYEIQGITAEGQLFYFGGGLKFEAVPRRGRVVKTFGLRAEGRALGRRHGVALDGGLHVAPAVGASLFARF